MRRDRFYLRDATNPIFTDSTVIHKLRDVLRKKKGDIINVFDGKGKEYEAKINIISPKIIELVILDIIREQEGSNIKVSLGFSLLKSSKVDYVLQKATELGIYEFLPFIASNTIVKKPRTSKIVHWKKIIQEASCQSGRLFLPHLQEVVEWNNIINGILNFDLILLAEPTSSLNVKQLLQQIDKGSLKNILLLVGPEGGFSSFEIEQITTLEKVQSIKISNFVLRAETACMLLTGLVIHYVSK